MADDNIFQQYLRPPKSVMEYTAEYDAADARKQALGQNALELAAGQQKYSDGVQSRQRADQLRQALMGLPQGATDDQRIQAMRGTASPEGFAAADALDKSLIERRKGTAAADKDDAETAKTKLAQSVALHNFQSQKLATVQSPEDALAWADESRALGLFSQPGQYEQGVARIQQAASNPQAFSQWKAAAMQGGQSVTDQLKQQFEQMKQQEQVRQFGITDQRIKSEGDANRAAASLGAADSPSDLGDDAVVNAAHRYNMDGTLPPMGMGKSGATGRTAILNKAAELAKAAGVLPEDQRTQQVTNKANSSALTQIQKQQTMVGAFERNFVKNADIALELSEKVDRSGMPIINKWVNAGKRSVGGDPDLAAFDASIKAVANEYAKIISGSMGNTATAMGEIKKIEALLNAAQTPQQVASVVNLMKRETKNRMAGFDEEKAHLRGSMSTGKPAGAPAAKPSLDDIFGK